MKRSVLSTTGSVVNLGIFGHWFSWLLGDSRFGWSSTTGSVGLLGIFGRWFSWLLVDSWFSLDAVNDFGDVTLACDDDKRIQAHEVLKLARSQLVQLRS